MLSFEEKKAAFHSFKLEEKKISNGRVNFVYPESRQRGQVLATQLHPSGNGYVAGKYMSDETIHRHGFKVDPRGWISIKDFSEEELKQVISEAMKSMAGEHTEEATIEDNLEAANDQKKNESDRFPADEPLAVSEKLVAPETDEEAISVSVNGANNKMGPYEEDDSFKSLESYPCSYMFFWVGLTLSTMEMGSLMWRSALRTIGDKSRSKKYKPKYFGRIFS